MREKYADVENLRDFYKGAYAALTAVLARVQELECDEEHYLEMQIVELRDQVLNSLIDSEAHTWGHLLGGGARDE